MKRIGFIFTVITLFCLSAVSRVIAQSDWSLINFDLINLPCEPGSHSLTYTMYYGVNPFKVKSFNDIECPIIFGGELVCTRSIDLKEKKEAVNRALSDLGWNFATLRQVIERAAQAKPNDIILGRPREHERVERPGGRRVGADQRREGSRQVLRGGEDTGTAQERGVQILGE